MKKMKLWVAGYLAIVLAALGVAGGLVYKVDPFFHYHAPDTETYYYRLNNERSQNNGISRNFDYDALITGTSMTENFTTTEMDALFGTHSIKVCYSGGTYREINDNLKIALASQPKLKTVVRCLDMEKFTQGKDEMRTDLGAYPTYLYDDNPFNDLKYVLNRNVIMERVLPMIAETLHADFAPGMDSFDEYTRWENRFTYGREAVFKDNRNRAQVSPDTHLSDEERETIRENIEANVTDLARQYPDVTFYYFLSPYSAAWWRLTVERGQLLRQIEEEQYVIELVLECPNIRLHSFNNRTDITTDLNNYKDFTHYGGWVNSLILRWMRDGEYLLTKENYREYLEEEYAFYKNFDYDLLNQQPDYAFDRYAAALLNPEATGAVPEQATAAPEMALSLKGHRYLAFEMRRTGEEAFEIAAQDERGKTAKIARKAEKVSGEWQMYVLDMRALQGEVQVKLTTDGYEFKNMTLY